MRVCVVGSGAREHALAHVLSRTAEVVVSPGNPGIAAAGIETTVAAATAVDADLYVVGPEAPLVAGLADELRALDRRVLGPGADGARLEGSKAFMKELAGAAGVPTAAWSSFDRVDDAVGFLRRLPGPYVVKTDGLAAGKGVLVTEDLAEAEADVAAKLSGSAFGDAGRRVVVEEGLRGEELSLLALCDGERVVVLPPAQDHKRLRDGDLGPNTGGMGASSPVPAATAAVVDDAMERILLPTVAELRRRGIDYRGVLYAGLMLTDEGPKLIEYNVRFGDPEAEVVLPRCSGDLAELCLQVAEGRLSSAPSVLDDVAVCVVLAANGYPTATETGAVIEGLDRAGTVGGVTIFHAGTRLDADGTVRVSGGRVLAVTALG
ncbi:MAG: phosphoribosylamine/glycine ligase, partial [Acidimicrobiaceae bacterium]|nr:phosphoribosylamine/glycine ligase [Acidimicrobiaceae bacterium]